jgi:hypothetical protein
VRGWGNAKGMVILPNRDHAPIGVVSEVSEFLSPLFFPSRARVRPS